MSELQQSCNNAARTVYATELQALEPQWLQPALGARLIASLPLLHLRQPVLVLRGTPTTTVCLLNLETHHAAG
jgi:hypothetical protein